MQSQGNCRRIVVLLVGMLILAVVCGGLILLLVGDDLMDFARTGLSRFSISLREDDLARPFGTDENPIRFTVNSGDTPRIIADNLLNNSLIADADLFVEYARASQLDTQFEAGTFFLNQTQTIPDIAQRLTDSRSSFIPFVIIEGWRLEEVADVIDSNPLFGFSGNEFLSVVGPGATIDPAFAQRIGMPQGASLEGFLYPDTYQLPPDITPQELANTLTQRFFEQVGTQLASDAEAEGLSLYEVVTLASIVEREAIHADEDAIVASVYRNRLDDGMKLDADPTVQYGLNGERGSWWPNITRADYTNVVSNYNTYLSTGLPPGPIANPGLSAIRAAAYPEESEFFYFRAACTGSGYHNFARTFEEHVANEC
ncbi:MAG: endolytic transglycosylase MltG [Burkholderiales bacterium]|nr:endolytic transglycosylase MltG [Anaerolineae bacterium]